MTANDNATPTAYDNLKERFAEIDALNGAAGILSKDAQTFMRRGSAEDRSQQIQTIAKQMHRLITEPQVAQWLDAAEKDAAALPADDRRNLFLMRRQWTDENALTIELARELARLGTEGEERHTKNKPGGDWSTMKDWYAHAFAIRKTVGELKMKAMPGAFASVYEALLDSFSPGMKDATIAREFDKLEQVLPAMIREACRGQDAAPAPLKLTGPFPIAQMEELCRRLLTAEGFDFNRGRLDISPSHPSSGGTADDARITARHDENDPLQTIYAALHEAGHAMYDQNRPLAWRYQPAGSHLGMGIHESQSRIMEIQAGHTPEFFRFLSAQMREVFNRPDDQALSAENLERLVNRFKPSFIRIEADEMTYPAHVILRYRLEKSIIEGKLDVADLPRAWNDGLQKMLGLTPASNAQGCMQDVHWPVGAVGYFPAYTIGDMAAAQFFAAACRAKPEIPSELAKGNFQPLNNWLNENVRGKAALLTPEELIRAATGEDLNADHYLNHLSQRYLGRPYAAAPQPGTGTHKPAP